MLAVFSPMTLRFFQRVERDIPEIPLPYALLFSAACVLFCLFFFFGRVYFIRNHFAHGVDVEGRVVFAVYRRDQGTLEYTYTFNEKEYKSWHLVHQSEYTDHFVAGQETMLVVNPRKPKRAFIRSIYYDD